MYRLDNEIRHYAWGSRTVIAELIGRPAGERPDAELWLGAHPLGSSRLADGQLLKDAIAADPERQLGERVNAEYPGRLPFLLKVLAAEHPLSLQAHPSPAQAKSGFAHEHEMGVQIDAKERSYRDAFAKPELFVALTDCEMLAGFRPAAEAAELLTQLGISTLSPYIASLLTGRPADGLRVVVTTLLSMPATAKSEMVQRVATESRRLVETAEPGRFTEAYRWMVELSERYPDDIGAVLSLLLNLVKLKPGQGIFVGAGKMHSYLCGAGIEAQANSDNTLRCGLTEKHIDVAELLRVLDFEPSHDQIIEAVEVPAGSAYCAGARTWPTPAREFALFEWPVTAEPREILAKGPSILLCLDGEVTVDGRDRSEILAKGESIYLPASSPAVTASGDGRLVHITVGQVPRGR